MAAENKNYHIKTEEPNEIKDYKTDEIKVTFKGESQKRNDWELVILYQNQSYKISIARRARVQTGTHALPQEEFYVCLSQKELYIKISPLEDEDGNPIPWYAPSLETNQFDVIAPRKQEVSCCVEVYANTEANSISIDYTEDELSNYIVTIGEVHDLEQHPMPNPDSDQIPSKLLEDGRWSSDLWPDMNEEAVTQIVHRIRTQEEDKEQKPFFMFKLMPDTFERIKMMYSKNDQYQEYIVLVKPDGFTLQDYSNICGDTLYQFAKNFAAAYHLDIQFCLSNLNGGVYSSLQYS